MITIKRSSASDPDFKALVLQLDADLVDRHGEHREFYAQYNKISSIKFVVLVYSDGVPAGCGSLKEHSASTMEIKRMFVKHEYRRKGIAIMILQELEKWSLELSCSRCILETGLQQQEAIGLYRKCGYIPIPNYDQYAGFENSVCFEKILSW
jgi:GNAT superfamily N-acetyltransferase